MASCKTQCPDYLPCSPFLPSSFPASPLAYPGALSCALASAVLPLRSHSPKWLWTPGYSGTSQRPWLWTLTCEPMQLGALCLRVCTTSTCLGVKTDGFDGFFKNEWETPLDTLPDSSLQSALIQSRESFLAGGLLWPPHQNKC